MSGCVGRDGCESGGREKVHERSARWCGGVGMWRGGGSVAVGKRTDGGDADDRDRADEAGVCDGAARRLRAAVRGGEPVSSGEFGPVVRADPDHQPVEQHGGRDAVLERVWGGEHGGRGVHHGAGCAGAGVPPGLHEQRVFLHPSDAGVGRGGAGGAVSSERAVRDGDDGGPVEPDGVADDRASADESQRRVDGVWAGRSVVRGGGGRGERERPGDGAHRAGRERAESDHAVGEDPSAGRGWTGQHSGERGRCGPGRGHGVSDGRESVQRCERSAGDLGVWAAESVAEQL